MRNLVFGCAAAALVLASAPAHADGFDGQRFVPAAGAAGGFSVERPLVLRHLGFGAGLFLHFAEDAVVVRQEPSGVEVAVPLDHALTLDLIASLGLFDRLELALVLPVDLVYQGDPVLVAGGQTIAAGPGLGDVRFVPKFLIWENGRPSFHYGFGVAAPVSFPSGDPQALRGDKSVTVEPKFLLDFGGERWDLTGNLGARLRSQTQLGDLRIGNEFTWGVAVTLALVQDSLDLQGELYGAVMPGARTGHTEAPLELIAGVIIKPTPQWSFYAGGGLGLTDGIGTPDFRLIGGVRFASNLPDRHRFEDPDQDGIINEHDQCPDQPEDFDGFQDDDGCPDPDNDQDGVPDDRDECPDDAAPGVPDGCPRGQVFVREGKVHLFGKILFHTGSAEIQRRSEPLLDDIATALKDHPELARIRVEGHTDNVGDAAMNVRLSDARAASVKRALLARGVPEGRLQTRGFGETRPVAPNRSPAGRARNRRVEFVILKD